jgi:peptide chain release factor 1
MLTDKFDVIERDYEEIERRLGDPDVLSDRDAYAKLAKAHADLAPLVEKIGEYRRATAALDDAMELEKGETDQEMVEFLHGEKSSLKEKIAMLEEAIRLLMLPKDPRDEKDVIMEIRGGAGGDEANLFAGDLYRMYTRYADAQGWKTQAMSASPSDVGGFREIIFEVKGKGAFSKLKYESGVHRVQRIPVTESGGRIHTSTATVAVLPEAEDVEVEMNPNDLRIDIFRSSGPGGQSVNTTDSAVRVTHLPTGMVVSCQDEKSQLQNKERALKILRARLYEKAQAEQDAELSAARRSQVGTGDRSERIRTYNFPQNRVTDHRIGMSVHNLAGVLEGQIDELIDALATADRAAQLEQVV